MPNSVIAWYTDKKEEIKGILYEGDPSLQEVGSIICSALSQISFLEYINLSKTELVVPYNKFFETFKPSSISHLYILDKDTRIVEVWINEHRDSRFYSSYQACTTWTNDWRFHKVYELDFVHIDNGDSFDYQTIDDYIAASRFGTFDFMMKKIEGLTVIKGGKE